MVRSRWRSAVLGIAIIGGGACGESRNAILEGTREDGESGGRHSAVPLDHSTGSPVWLLDTAIDAGAVSMPPEPDDPAPAPDDASPVPMIPADAGSQTSPDASDEPPPESDAGPVLQAERCGAEESCNLECAAEACVMDCTEANNCKVDCGRSASCEVSCIDANNCEPKCHQGECAIDCTGANNCDHVRCSDDAACIVYCGEETNCKIEGCAELTRCANNVLVCNRACPQ